MREMLLWTSLWFLLENNVLAYSGTVSLYSISTNWNIKRPTWEIRLAKLHPVFDILHRFRIIITDVSNYNKKKDALK